MTKEISLSTLSHTWIFDLDGTICKHNGYKIDGKDTLLKGVKEFFDKIPKEDKIIFCTARSSSYKEVTERFLKDIGINYFYIIYDLPVGERILINDRKPNGLETAKAINLTRNEFSLKKIEINEDL